MRWLRSSALVAALFALPAYAQIAYVSVCQDFEADNNTTFETPTCVVSGSDLYAVAFPLSGAGPNAPSSVKWGGSGGADFTIEGTRSAVDFASISRWYKASPAASTATLYYTLAAADDEQAGFALFYSGVGSLRTSPTPVTGTDTLPGITASITATTVSGDMVVGCVAFTNTVNAALTLTADGAQTARGSNYDGSPVAYYSMACSEKLATTTSTTLTWTGSTGSGATYTYAVMAFVLVPGSAGGSSVVPIILQQSAANDDDQFDRPFLVANSR